MGSLHFGSKELLFVQTKDVRVIIKGNASHKYSHNKDESEKKCSSVSVRTASSFEIAVEEEPVDDKYINDKNSIITKPLFFEQQRYELLIESLNGQEISFWHENINIRENISYLGKHRDFLSGILNFGNDIGYSDLIVLSKNKEILRIKIEVFPSKISYKDDYKVLIQDVIVEVYNLVFDFLKKTYAQLNINPDTKASPVEFYAIIEKIFSKFEKALNSIIKNPYHILQTIREILPDYKAKKTDSRSIKWIQNHPEYIKKNGKNYKIEKILTVKKQVTYDTKENQFLKFILIATQKKLKNFENNYRLLERGNQSEVIFKIQKMIKSLEQSLNNTFLRDVSSLNTTSLMSLVFTMAPGYRDIYKYYLMLQHGLSLTGDLFNLSLKDIAQLYEYWCFIKLNRILKDKKYVLASPDIIKVETKEITVNLKKGTTSKIRYLNPKNNEIIELSYNPSKRESPTGPQKPDNVLSIEKKGNSIYQYVFDAKYRLDPGTDSIDPERQTPGPKEDSINTMHRYRDAIVYNTSKNGRFDYERSMFGAYVLFPYNNEEEYKNHRFYKSIEQVNVGGFPFLPTATTLVSNFLEELIEDSPNSAFERATLPFGIEEKLKSVDWDKKDVLIGMLRKDQLDKALKYKFYHIPASQIKDEDLPIHWIAMYQSANIYKESPGIHYYGEVIRCFKTKRKNFITKIPLTHNNLEELYYIFEVKSWEKLQNPIAVKEFGPVDHKFTNLFLLQTSTIFPELFLKNEEEYRLFSEIKYRIQNPEYVENPFGLKVTNSKTLFFNNDEISIVQDNKIVNKISFSDFLRHPQARFNEIQDI